MRNNGVDADAVIDQSDFTDPFHYSKSITYVIVKGELVMDQERHGELKSNPVLEKRILTTKFTKKHEDEKYEYQGCSYFLRAL